MTARIKLSILFTCLFCAFTFSNPSFSMDSHYKDLLIRMVNQNSDSENYAGNESVRKMIIPEMKKMGFEVDVVQSQTNKNRYVLHACVKNSHPEILFIGHIDTVFPSETGFTKFTEDANKMYGPGVTDMKGGIVLILNVINNLTKEERKHVQIIVNDDEEPGSSDSRLVYKNMLSDAKYALVFESSSAQGNLVTSTAGAYTFSINAKGVSTHAGNNFYDGVNACSELSLIIPQILNLTNKEDGVTVSLGSINGGAKSNNVCEDATAIFDLRYSKFDDIKRINVEIEKIISSNKTHYHNTNAQVFFTLQSMSHCSPMESRFSSKIYNSAVKAAKETNMKIAKEHTNGTNDGNILLEYGVPNVISGLGMPGGNIHTTDEYAITEGYNQMLIFDTALVKDLIRDLT